MSAPGITLIIISRDALIASTERADSVEIFRVLARLYRKGYSVLLTAPEPERWVPTRKTVDSALDSQRSLMERARAEGGDIEGVYYVPRSLLTQDRNRVGALQDILARYSTTPASATLISTSTPFLRAAGQIGIKTIDVSEGLDMRSALESSII